MGKINITFQDGTTKEYPKGITPLEIAKETYSNSASKWIVARVNDGVVDLSCPMEEDVILEFLGFDSPIGKETYWHSTSHIMAQAVKHLFPEVKLGIGPAIDQGFYYDFEKDSPFSAEDLERIEKKMQEIIEENQAFKRIEFSKESAIELFSKKQEKYKLELIAEIPQDKVIVYQQNDFVDLCRGPHIPSAGRIKAFKLLSVAGAYWRGKETNPMLQRIYGTSFLSPKDLDEYMKRLEEMKKRDHRILGKELELFSISEDVGPGLVLWHPKGAQVRRIIEDFWVAEHQKHGYQLVYTPHVARLHLWEISGHTGFYRESMYSTMRVEDEEYQLKPMNCPFHILIYKSKLRSYRELPLKLAELGACYRYERSGVLQGLVRVRGFTMDDAHIFCKPEQLEEEVTKLLGFSLAMLKTLGFDQYQIFLATRPEKSIGDEQNWGKATSALRQALEKQNLIFEVDEGGGAFYGPKIDLKIRDVMGRPHQCTTIQFDFNIPERFDLWFVGGDGNYHRPIMIHRALLGSLERFFGVLIEHYGGAFPLWLSPTQVMIMPITDQQKGFASEVLSILRKEGLRAEVDDRNEKINYKIREAESQKVPYMIVLGKREEEGRILSVRKHKQGDLGSMEIEKFLRQLKEEAKSKQ